MIRDVPSTQLSDGPNLGGGDLRAEDARVLPLETARVAHLRERLLGNQWQPSLQTLRHNAPSGSWRGCKLSMTKGYVPFMTVYYALLNITIDDIRRTSLMIAGDVSTNIVRYPLKNMRLIYLIEKMAMFDQLVDSNPHVHTP